MSTLNYSHRVRSDFDHLENWKGTMDKRLAGLSILLTLGWVITVVTVIWYFYPN